MTTVTDDESRVKAQAVDTSDLATSGAAATTATAPALTYCKTMLLFSTNVGCQSTGSGPNDLNPTDGNFVGVGPVVTQCSTLVAGTPLTATTPAPTSGSNYSNSSYVCFQFLVTTPMTQTLQVQLPPGTTGLAELYVEGSNTFAYKQAGSENPASPLSINFTTQNSRMVLVVRTSNGSQGQAMGIGLGVPAPGQMPNSTYQNATVVPMGQTVAGTITTPGVSEAYYFYPQKTGQTTQEVEVDFTANQTATYRSAQLTAPNTYVLSPEMTIAQSAAGTVLPITTPNAPNVAGTTTPYGLMVKIKGVSATAPIGEAFSLRVATRANTIGGMSLTNTDNISRYFPGYSGQLQAATYISAALSAIDSSTALVPGERVRIQFKQNTSDVNATVTQDYITDTTGRLFVNFTLPKCSGTTIPKTNYGPAGSPTDHYNGTAQTASVTASLLDSSIVKPVTLTYLRICTETYLGRY